MLVFLDEYGMYAEITGFKGIRIKDPKEIAYGKIQEKRRANTIQFLNARCIATWEHLYFALLDALLSFRNGYNISRSLGVEVMLYASAQRQIKKAIDLVGVKCGCSDLALIIVDNNEELVKRSLSAIVERMEKAPDETVLELSRKKAEGIQRVFGISETEISTVASENTDKALLDLVIERMALLATKI